MPKDYVRYVNQPKRPLAEHGWRRRLFVVIIFLFLIASTGYGFFIYKRYQNTMAMPSFSLGLKKITSLFEKKPVSANTVEDKEKVDSQQQEADIQFSFYTNLPAMQVSPPPEHEKITVKTESQPIETVTKVVEKVAEKENLAIGINKKVMEGKYLLQLAAFKNPSAASEMRISLLLAGFEVEIVKTMHDNQIIYQVQQGPFFSVSQAKVMQHQLKEKGIESVVVKKIA